MVRRTALIGTALAAALLAGAGTASADVIVTDPFAATSGDECRMGVTKGTLAWHGPGLRRVDVRGTVVDRGPSSGPGLPCGDDRRFTTATFTAYSGGVRVVPPQVVRADNGQQAFTFQLTARTPVDVVVVQICRHPLGSGPAKYCGKPDVHRAPVIG